MTQQKIDPKNVYVSGTSSLAPSPKGKAEKLNEEESEKRISQVKDFFDQLSRGIKTIQLYRHNTAQYGEYLDRAYRALKEILKRYDNLSVKVDQLGFKYFDETVYQEDATEQNIAHKFYRDGVRILIFREGLRAPEFLDFILICLTNFSVAEFIYDDMVSLMWKQEFSHVEYVVVETFAVGTESQEDAKVEVDKIVNYLYARLTSNTDDTFSFARISLEDLEIELDDVEQAKGVVIKGNPATPEEKSQVLQQLDEEDENRALPKLVVILFKVVEEELDQDLGQAIEEVFIQLLDSFLIHEDFRSINQMLRKFKGMARKNLPAGNLARIQQIETKFTTKMGEAERIGRVGEILDSSAEIKEPQEVYRYLTRLDEPAILPLLQTLETMERQEARRLICDTLAALGKDHLDVFVRRLESTKANVIRDMLYIIDRLNPAEKLQIIAKVLEHPNLALRLEALNTIGSAGEESCYPYVIKALKDSDTQMRIMAARLLSNFDIRKATKTLLILVDDQGFSRKPAQEQTAMFSALAMTDSPDAMDFFREHLRSTSLLSKKKLVEHKRNIVNGLAISGSIAAFKLLKAELEAGIKEEDVLAAAERACEKLRHKLLGN
ncbi:MAG: HEAT repeat domain-containing protein [Deltaproteobacteria bacterium]|nr:HEAT repeat domain-containing protein [Deltaproteobacteria bacterium]